MLFTARAELSDSLTLQAPWLAAHWNQSGILGRSSQLHLASPGVEKASESKRLPSRCRHSNEPCRSLWNLQVKNFFFFLNFFFLTRVMSDFADFPHTHINSVCWDLLLIIHVCPFGPKSVRTNLLFMGCQALVSAYPVPGPSARPVQCDLPVGPGVAES